MRLILVIIAIVFIVLAMFTAANWQILTTVTPLSFIAFSIEGPLGVILLCVSLGLTFLVVAYALLLRTNWLMESRRLNKQLDEQRALAEKAETSRITLLNEMIISEFEKLTDHISKLDETNSVKIETVHQSMDKIIEETGNSIIAHIGYLDDKLKK